MSRRLVGLQWLNKIYFTVIYTPPPLSYPNMHSLVFLHETRGAADNPNCLGNQSMQRVYSERRETWCSVIFQHATQRPTRILHPTNISTVGLNLERDCEREETETKNVTTVTYPDSLCRSEISPKSHFSSHQEQTCGEMQHTRETNRLQYFCWRASISILLTAPYMTLFYRFACYC